MTTRIKKRPPDKTCGVTEPDDCEVGTPQLSESSNFSTWEVLPTDGFKVKAQPGKISIIQEPVCADTATVTLSVPEAVKLREVLTSAIMAAQGKAHRG